MGGRGQNSPGGNARQNAQTWFDSFNGSMPDPADIYALTPTEQVAALEVIADQFNLGIQRTQRGATYMDLVNDLYVTATVDRPYRQANVSVYSLTDDDGDLVVGDQALFNGAFTYPIGAGDKAKTGAIKVAIVDALNTLSRL